LPRSARREVRNPILTLPAARRILVLPLQERAVLADRLQDLATDAGQGAQNAGRRHEAPMAAYRKAWSV
jgi:hypothetical protein